MSASRFPMPAHPLGWFHIGYSDELAPGQVEPVRVFGQDLVLFRTVEGQVRVFDAHCRHMGAHLGYGGRVDEQGIHCPFHAWCYDASGACVDVPYTDKPAPRVSLSSWPVHETSGLILLANARGSEPPAWRLPAIPEFTDPAWFGYTRAIWRVRTHVQEIAENIPDSAHFHYVHHTTTLPEAQADAQGHVFHTRSAMKQPTPRGPVDAVIEAHGHGLGLWLIRFTGIIETLFVSAMTPVDDGVVELRNSYLVKEGEGATELSRLGQGMVRHIGMQIEQDIPIWENKIYRDKPVLMPGDGPVREFRAWAEQFYARD